MNPEAFMLSDRLEKLMCSPQSQQSLQSLSRPCRLHVARLKRYFIEVWGRSGRRPSSPRGHIFCPIRLISVWMADLSNPVTWLPLYACTFCVRPRWSLLGLAFLCGFFCGVPIERPAAGHHWMCCSLCLSQWPRTVLNSCRTCKHGSSLEHVDVISCPNWAGKDSCQLSQVNKSDNYRLTLT